MQQPVGVSYLFLRKVVSSSFDYEFAFWGRDGGNLTISRGLWGRYCSPRTRGLLRSLLRALSKQVSANAANGEGPDRGCRTDHWRKRCLGCFDYPSNNSRSAFAFIKRAYAAEALSAANVMLWSCSSTDKIRAAKTVHLPVPLRRLNWKQQPWPGVQPRLLGYLLYSQSRLSVHFFRDISR